MRYAEGLEWPLRAPWVASAVSSGVTGRAVCAERLKASGTTGRMRPEARNSGWVDE